MDNYQVVTEPMPDGPGFLATVPALPGCMSDGATEAEARAAAAGAIREWVDECRRLGRPVPPAP